MRVVQGVLAAVLVAASWPVVSAWAEKPANVDKPKAAPSAHGKASDTDACPPHMKLVDADYCTDVEQECLKSWFDEPNKKVVCEEFKPPSKCVGEHVHKRYCMDQYAWPNVKGERPEVMNNFYQAEVKCASVGKRMCTESEWTLACEGPEMKPFPYGYVRDPNKCNVRPRVGQAEHEEGRRACDPEEARAAMARRPERRAAGVHQRLRHRRSRGQHGRRRRLSRDVLTGRLEGQVRQRPLGRPLVQGRA